MRVLFVNPRGLAGTLLHERDVANQFAVVRVIDQQAQIEVRFFVLAGWDRGREKNLVPSDDR